MHPSHVTRISMDASTYDEICVNCGSTDIAAGGWGDLANPCSNPPSKGGLTMEQWYEKRAAKVASLQKENGK